ncbi:AAA family ATPase [Aeromonas jandaei]|uniref:ATP-dependent nuclease n=1 Tax=Aeromonas jandaei TaxID=650 RepID=UPI001C2478DF|nr:ATP-binding protein [Aeromonas sp. FDAARGOS 1410]
MIRQISIKHFRSIIKQVVSVEEITTFVGRNDAGKSNILRALNLFFKGKTDYNREYDFTADYCKFAPEYSQRAKEIIVELVFKLPKSYRKEDHPSFVYWTKVWRSSGPHRAGEKWGLCDLVGDVIKDKQDFPEKSQIPAMLSRIDFEYIPAIKDERYFENLQVKLYDALSALGLHESSSSFENEINKHVQELMESISKEFSGSNMVKLPTNLGAIFRALEFSSNGIPLSRRGDGIKIRHIPMLLSFIASRKQSQAKRALISPQIWAFEEPENNVEFLSCFELTRQIIDAAKSHTQILITTHSPAIYSITRDASLPDNLKTASYYVTKANNETIIEPTGADSLHGNMGFLQLIAPLVEEKKKLWEEKEDKYKHDYQKLAKAIEETNLPHLFLEGHTDRRVISRILKFKNLDSKLKIYVPNDGSNCANSACDRGHAFALMQKHKKNPVKGLILVDKDDAGSKAIESINSALQNSNYLKAEKLPPNEDLKKLYSNKKLKVSVDLEKLMPPELWNIAKQENWIEVIEDNMDKLNENGCREVVNAKMSFDEIINQLTSHQIILVNYKFTDDGKEKISKLIKNLNDDDPLLEKLAQSFSKVISIIERNLLKN